MFIESLDARRLFTTGLDTGFADAGQLAFPDAFTPDNVATRSVESGDNGSIFVSGKTADGHDAIAKYDRNGHLMTEFGTGGYAVVPFEVDHMAYVTTGGVLYVVGNDTINPVYPNTGETPPSLHTSVARLGPAGAIEPGFGSKGVFDYRLPTPEGGNTFVTTSIETINPLPDGSVLLGVDRATRWRSGSADQDLALIKLRPNGTFDTRFGTGGITQVLTGYFEPNYATDATRRAHGYRACFPTCRSTPTAARGWPFSTPRERGTTVKTFRTWPCRWSAHSRS